MTRCFRYNPVFWWHKLEKEQQQYVERQLGELYRFDAKNPTGHYRLDLARTFDRLLAMVGGNAAIYTNFTSRFAFLLSVLTLFSEFGCIDCSDSATAENAGRVK